MKGKVDSRTVLSGLVPYPAVFVPNSFGGWDVFFPNFPNSTAMGLNLDLAHKAAVEELTVRLHTAFKDGGRPAPPSDPGQLVPDEDEPPGTRVVMIEPNRELLLSLLGLEKRPKRTSPSGVKYKP